jgi:hypothetical protein
LPFAELAKSWLRAGCELEVSVIHEQLVTDYSFTGHYQRVKMLPQRRGGGSLQSWRAG